jgi:SAM-dependent methyltransferase
LLGLGPDVKLLDVGAGSGWPGLYLAQLTGCDIVMVDLPLAALRIARERAAKDGLIGRCEAVAADGASLPFGDASFDALSHSDVLCCTPDKVGVLRACRRVARDGAKMVFTVIYLAPSLTEAERGIAMESGPKFIDADDDYAVLLEQSGWCLQERTNVTDTFLQSMRAELDGMCARAGELAQVFGPDDFDQRLKRQEAQTAAIDSGFVRREIFVARAERKPPHRDDTGA